MIDLEKYVGEICNSFEKNLFDFEKIECEDKDDLYGDYYKNFENTTRKIIKTLFNDIKKKIEDIFQEEN